MDPKHSADDSHPANGGGDPHDALRAAIGHAAHLLPAQGPISVFIHHNTLHAFEKLPFDEAVRRGGEVFGCEPYLSEDRYRAELRKGRIRVSDLEAVLHLEMAAATADPLVGTTTPFDLRRTMLERPIWAATAAELAYYLAETGALHTFRDDVPSHTRLRLAAETRRWVMRDVRPLADGSPGWVGDLFRRFGARGIETWDEGTWEAVTVESLWRVCLDGIAHAPPPAAPPARPLRPRDRLFRATGTDTDLLVNDLLVRFTAAFLDQGISAWPLPDRGDGLFRCFLRMYARPGGPADSWLRPLRAEAARLLAAGTDAPTAARESLALLGVPAAEWDDYFSATLLALRGWGGMVREVELRGDRVAYPIPAGSLEGFVAIRLLLDRLAAAHVARAELDYRGPLAELKTHLASGGKFDGECPPPAANQRAFPVFQLAQLLGWSPAELARLTADGWASLYRAVEGFHGVERRRVFHHAYERRFRIQTLDAVALHPPHRVPAGSRPRFQVVTCIDEREESFRRHLEEAVPDCETLSAPGFFGVVMYHRGVRDAHSIPLCPIVVRPRHWVEEQVPDPDRPTHLRRARARRRLGRTTRALVVGSRTIVAGTLLSLLGVLTVIPLVAQVLFPRLTAGLRHRLGEAVAASPSRTRLALERRDAAEPGPTGDGLGFTVAEMTDIAERLLRDLGLADGFARLVLFLGHGSHSMNNPHESAHDCGACGGAVGGPNGRAVAQILNDPRVRAGLAARGLAVPADTTFVGGLHNTCNEYVDFPDADLVPDTHAGVFAEALAALEEALDRGSHERARRFDTAPLSISNAAARKHMGARAEDLAQVRPEWGHATNAACVVGRRARTRGLFLDRRAFLNSYDPTRDDADGTILGRILSAAVPVCGGISLEYYFSHVDNPGYGCGTKLPHNVTGLLGVMDGAASDLRTGLPWQMVEIHEAMRILFVIEATAEVLTRVMDRIPVVGDMIRNGWVLVSVLDPHSQQLHWFDGSGFVPYHPAAGSLPVAPSSADWYRGWRDHLDFAEIRPGA